MMMVATAVTVDIDPTTTTLRNGYAQLFLPCPHPGTLTLLLGAWRSALQAEVTLALAAVRLGFMLLFVGPLLSSAYIGVFNAMRSDG